MILGIFVTLAGRRTSGGSGMHLCRSSLLCPIVSEASFVQKSASFCFYETFVQATRCLGVSNETGDFGNR